MVVAGRRHLPRSGGPAVKRLAAGTRRLVPDALRRDSQDRWAAAFGRIAGYSFAMAVVTGVLLLPFFRPSMAPPGADPPGPAPACPILEGDPMPWTGRA